MDIIYPYKKKGRSTLVLSPITPLNTPGELRSLVHLSGEIKDTPKPDTRRRMRYHRLGVIATGASQSFSDKFDLFASGSISTHQRLSQIICHTILHFLVNKILNHVKYSFRETSPGFTSVSADKNLCDLGG